MHLLGMLAAVVTCSLVGMALTQRGSFDESAALAVVVASGSGGGNLALVAGTTLPAGVITGSADVFLENTTNTPGTQTTRTAAQMIADMILALGVGSLIGYSFSLRITHQGTGTLTLAAGTGVTFGTGTYTVATATFRDFLVTVTGPATMSLQTTGVGTWS